MTVLDLDDIAKRSVTARLYMPAFVTAGKAVFQPTVCLLSDEVDTLVALARELGQREEERTREVSRLRAVVEDLRNGLQPFAKCSLEAPQDQGLKVCLATRGQEDYAYGDVRRARDLLAETAPNSAQSREASKR